MDVEDKTVALTLTEDEVTAVFRALIDYRRSLQYSAIYDSTLVEMEMRRVDSVSEKISLSYHYPIGAPYVCGK